MKDYEDFPPLEIVGAEGSFLILRDGRRIIDSGSSWWCKSLGHGHPKVREAVLRQIDRFEHVIGANTCQEPLVELSERLAALFPGLDRVFYAGDGSSAVEVAMKMSVQFHAQTGAGRRRSFASLENGYHGETFMTLALGGLGLYSSPFNGFCPSPVRLTPVPRRPGPDDSRWTTFDEEEWLPVQAQLDAHADTLAAVIVEPILQGAGGMLVHPPGFLARLRSWTARHDVHLIADEVMTGLGRTGFASACSHAKVTPDFLVLSKGLTSGWTAFSAVLTPTRIYDAFYADYLEHKAFMHSNTFSGNAIGAAAALATLKVMEDEDLFRQVARRSGPLLSRMRGVAAATGCLTEVRGVGFAVAADLADPSSGLPFPPEARIGFRVYRGAVELGALLRPLGDTIYILPPLNTSDRVLDDLAEIAAKAIRTAVRG